MSASDLREHLAAQVAAMGSAETGGEMQGSEPREACGALSKRTGKPCKVKVTYPNGRCHAHGGPSTGPKTEAGFAQVRLNLQAAHAQRARQREEADEQRRQQEERRRAENPPSAPLPLEASARVLVDELLPDELQHVLRLVGPAQYGYATAREFAIGKYSGRRTRPRFAKM